MQVLEEEEEIVHLPPPSAQSRPPQKWLQLHYQGLLLHPRGITATEVIVNASPLSELQVGVIASL